MTSHCDSAALRALNFTQAKAKALQFPGPLRSGNESAQLHSLHARQIGTHTLQLQIYCVYLYAYGIYIHTQER